MAKPGQRNLGARREEEGMAADAPRSKDMGIAADSFDVTCTIGTVEFGLARAGRLTPVEAAFVLIAKHDAEGTFHFTVPGGEVDGWEYEVSVGRRIAG